MTVRIKFLCPICIQWKAQLGVIKYSRWEQQAAASGGDRKHLSPSAERGNAEEELSV